MDHLSLSHTLRGLLNALAKQKQPEPSCISQDIKRFENFGPDNMPPAQLFKDEPDLFGCTVFKFDKIVLNLPGLSTCQFIATGAQFTGDNKFSVHDLKNTAHDFKLGFALHYQRGGKPIPLHLTFNETGAFLQLFRNTHGAIREWNLLNIKIGDQIMRNLANQLSAHWTYIDQVSRRFPAPKIILP